MKLSKMVMPAMVLSFLFASLGAADVSAQTLAGPAQDSRMSMFYNSLKPYGEWVYNNTYGWCWYPYNIPVDWRPYTEGRWIYTDAGWAFDSDAPYGWATFHYGRWFYDDDQGWLWYPDTKWAPCWVAWRYNKSHVGWAPLTPDCVWRDDTGLSLGNYDPNKIPLNYYTFCHMKDFAGDDLQSHYLLIAKNATYIQKTQFVPGTLRFSNAAVNNELPFHNALVRVAGHDFQRIHLVTVNSAQDHKLSGNEYKVFRPEVAFKNGKVPLFNGTKPKALATQQTQETQALAQFQQNRRNSLDKDHVLERQNPPDDVNRAQLDNQHKRELQAQTEQQQREQRLLKSEQQRQVHVTTAPNAPQQKQHYALPAAQPEKPQKPELQPRKPETQPQRPEQNDPRQKQEKPDANLQRQNQQKQDPNQLRQNQ